MIRFQKIFASVQECITRFVSFYNIRWHTTRGDFCQQTPLFFEPVHSRVSLPSSHTPNTGQQSMNIPLRAARKLSATVTVDTHAAHGCKFSYGSGLIVYKNGALISAAHVALKVNIATLELVRRLPHDDLSTVGVYLAAAFADDGREVDVAWAEVDSETERDWREAEHSWSQFSGGPYEVCETEEHSDNSLLQRSLFRFEEREPNRLSQHRSAHVAGRAAFCEWRRSSEESTSLYSDTEDSLLSLPHSNFQAQPAMTAAVSNALSAGSNSPSLLTSWSEEEDTEMTAVELKAILRNECPHKTPSSSSLGRESVRGPRSPGKGDGAIMSSEDFDALPEWSDVEDGSDLNSAGSPILELDEYVEPGETTRGRAW